MPPQKKDVGNTVFRKGYYESKIKILVLCLSIGNLLNLREMVLKAEPNWIHFSGLFKIEDYLSGPLENNEIQVQY